MSSFSHTAAQQEAISTLDRNLLVLASAGTGKTYVLVRRFLYILEHRDWPVSSLVALTFTKMAAQEMRARILREVNEGQRQATDSVWRRRAAELSQLQISTVHSFCERVLRQYAVEAGIDPDFTVIAEDEGQNLQEQAINLTFADMAREEEKWLEALPRYTRADLQHTLRHAFTRRSTLHYMIDQKAVTAESLQSHWRILVEEEMDSVWQQYEATYPELMESMAWLERISGPDQLPVWDAEDKLGQQMDPSLQAVQALRDRNWTAATEVLAWASMKRKQKGAKDKWRSAEALALARRHVGNVRAALRFLQGQEFSSQADPRAPEAARVVQVWLQLWDKALTHYTRLKQAHLGLDYDDLEIRALQLLQEGRKAPESRVGRFVSGIRQVLVDEHQDINPVQQQIIDTLAPIARAGRLFVVGDTKQSIYRFRQAQVTAFAGLAVQLRQKTGHAATTLDSSFRTQKHLVAATNRLFHHVLTPVLGEEFARFEAKPLPLSSDIKPLQAQAVAVELHVVRKQGANLSGFDLKQDEVRVIANRLIQMKEKGMAVRDGQQSGRHANPAFQWRDAAILLRSGRDVEIFETVLRDARIPYQVVAEVPLQSRLPVRALLALLRHLHRPADDFHLAVALRSPLFGIDDETLYWLLTRRRATELPLHRFAEMETPVDVEQAARLAQAAQILADLYPWVHTLSPESLLHRILEKTGLLEICMADKDRYRGTRHLEEIKAFQTHLRTERRPLGELLRRCTSRGIPYQHAEEEGLAHAGGRVQIMTIHKSKGLEFPVVFVPQLNRKLGGNNAVETPMLLFDPEFGMVCQLRDEWGGTRKPRSYWAAMHKERRMRYVETKRILYVACTRAAERLVLTGVHTSKDPIGPCARTDQGYALHWLSEVLEAYDLQDELFAMDRSHTVTRRDGATEFQVRCAGYQAGELDRRTNREDRTGIGIGTPTGIELTALSLPLASKAEDFREIDPDTRQQRIGTFTHDFITQWNVWYPRSPDELQDLVASRLHQADLADAQAKSDVLAYLNTLRNSPFARAIDAAPVKHWEVPVALRENDHAKHRRIDLLYQDREGQWHIVDWKTERVTAATLPVIMQRYLGSLATYAQAIDKLLGQYPKVSLCFLSPEIRVVPVSRQELAAVPPA